MRLLVNTKFQEYLDLLLERTRLGDLRPLIVILINSGFELLRIPSVAV